jgi:hypothetical protein
MGQNVFDKFPKKEHGKTPTTLPPLLRHRDHRQQ